MVSGVPENCGPLGVLERPAEVGLGFTTTATDADAGEEQLLTVV